MKKLFGNMGFINQPFVQVATNIYMPKGLRETVFHSKHNTLIGHRKDYISGGGISFDVNHAKMSALGEYVERYSSGFYKNERLTYGNFDELSVLYNCYPPSRINYFSRIQHMDDNFNLKRLYNYTNVHWIKGKYLFSNKSVWFPFFMVNLENIKSDGLYHFNTTTGTAAHTSLEKAIFSGLLECIERDAFAKFIAKKFPGDPIIKRLFNNKKINIITYNISEKAYAPTFVTFILFKKQGKVYQAVGSASRLNAKEALIKSCIEAYQGIEYTTLTCEKTKTEITKSKIYKYDFSEINNFEKHYALYNLFPFLIEKVPLLKNIWQKKNFDDDWKINYKHHVKNFSLEELKNKGLNEIYYVNLSTIDVKQLGLKVVKVITPNLNLLTGNFNYPYLGLFDNSLDLFTEFPHPFP